jgi:hypothetical protein
MEACHVQVHDGVVVFKDILGERLTDENTGIIDQRVDTAEAYDLWDTMRCAVAGSPMSPAMVTMFGSLEGLIVREVATT